MRDLFLLWRTVRHLRFIQITNRLYRRFVKPRPDYSPAPPINDSLKLKSHFISRPKSILEDGAFSFLNIQNSPSFPGGWNDSNNPKLWLYNLHYFEGLLNEDTPTQLKKNLIEQWIYGNPAGIGNGWEPYPNSLRICNWIKWQLLTGQLPKDAINSLAVQIRYLEKTLEYHLLGNHLFANAKALVFAGVFFKGQEADRWLEKGINILKQQIPEQFLSDGAHFELSTTYHTLLTEDLLDIHQLMSITNNKLDGLDTAIERAIIWLQVMTRPDGSVPLFNDAAYGVTPTPKDITSYASRLNLNTPNFVPKGMTDLAESGYYRFDSPSYSLFGDAGQIGPSYLPGHAHCDMLSFELCINAKPFLVDTGTSTYGKNAIRAYERSTAAHNTVQIGNEEQSEIWGEFRVGRRAKIIQRIFDKNRACATLKSINGTHQREIIFNKFSLTITDTVQSRETNKLNTARFHFHPSFSPVIKDQTVIAADAQFLFENALAINVIEKEYAPEFNLRSKISCIEVVFRDKLETIITVKTS